jgi:hypothetical protein
VVVFFFDFFSPPLEKKSVAGEIAEEMAASSRNCANSLPLAGDCSCAFKTQKQRGELRIDLTCGVNAALGE